MPTDKEILQEWREIEREYNQPDSMIDMGNLYYIAHKLATALEAAEKVRNEWQPIETAPKDGKHILAYVNGKLCVVRWEVSIFAKGWTIYKTAKDKKYFLFLKGIETWLCVNPTHWMPLPQPPKEGEQMKQSIIDKDFTGQTISDLPNGVYYKCNFSHVKFECDLEGKRFYDCNLYDTDWTKASNMQEAEFTIVANRDPFKARKASGEPIMKLNKEQLEVHGKWMGR